MKRSVRLVLVAGLVLLASCAPPRGGSRVPVQPALDAEATLQAQGDLDRLRTLLDARDTAAALQLARTTLVSYPGFESRDAVLLLGAQAADAEQDLRRAEEWLVELVEQHGESVHRVAALEHLVRLSRSRGLDRQEATALLALGASDPAHPQSERLDQLLGERLSIGELDRLAERLVDDELRARVEVLAARRSVAEGRSPTLVSDRLIAFLRAHPEHPAATEIRAELGRISRDLGVAMPPDVELILDDRIGILCPLTGENASLGQAMFDGALLALEEHNRSTGSELHLVSIDTRGDGVRAVQAARKLIEEDGVLAIVGALLSSTTIPVATLCQERGVPLISPTATQETIVELGNYIFQTNLTRNVETRLVAEAAVEKLHRRRFAILYPQTEEGKNAAEFFQVEVERRGARVVAALPLERGVTDYAVVLKGLRELRPEAIFAPVSPSEMRLIAPQLTFNGIETQLLGPSSWNNSLLGREVGEFLDRALFPSDIALIPEAERERFHELWDRRYRGQPSNPFALKSYFAVRRVLEAMADGADSRESLQQYFEEHFSIGGADRRLGLEKLRMLVDGKFEPFPVEIFPVVATVPEDDRLEIDPD
ncbi:MAG TPA: penicillin-binding protein activator [Candidatus Krumholzibacteria bacterium]